MSKGNLIGMRVEDGTVWAVQCTSGSPVTVGRILLEDYQDMEKVRELINLGKLDSLGSDNAQCFAYHRDGNADWQSCRPQQFLGGPKGFRAIENLENVGQGIDTVFCWTADGWYARRANGPQSRAFPLSKQIGTF